MSRAVKRATLPLAVVLAIAAVVLLSLLTTAPPGSGPATARPEGPSVTRGALVAALHRAGLTPQSLAAAGAGSSATTAVITAMAGYLGESPAAFTDADAALVTASADADTLERLVQAGKASSEQVTALATARTALASAVSGRGTVVSSAFSAAAAGLSGPQRDALNRMRANSTGPAEEASIDLRSVDRSAEAWLALREALAQERIAVKRGQEVPAGAASLLATARADVGASAAASNLTTNLAGVQSAWDTAIANYPTGG